MAEPSQLQIAETIHQEEHKETGKKFLECTLWPCSKFLSGAQNPIDPSTEQLWSPHFGNAGVIDRTVKRLAAVR